MLVATDLAKNAWHTAKVRADRTGVALAGLLARTDVKSYILVGHSLGARAMIAAARTLATNPNGPKITTVHLLGAAVGAKGDWRSLNDAVSDAVYNYHSANDKVLRYLYTVVQAGSRPAGLRGFRSKFPKIKDRNVSRLVASHSGYCHHINLA
jgi:pimeloyl-ACP methyl ester carboxylesterase